MKKLLAVFALFSIITGLQAQLAIGEFRTHLPYNSFQSVVAGNDYIYASTGTSLMLIDKKNDDIYTWSKMDGLSDVGISKIHFSKNDDMLIIAYSNSNLDFIKNDRLFNISDIKNKQITGNKAINNIFVDNSYAYLACSFGIVIIDLNNLIITDTWFSNVENEYYNILDFVSCNDRFYASTSKGIFSIDKNNPFKGNFAEWSFESDAGIKVYPDMESFNNILFAVVRNEKDSSQKKDTLYILQNDLWEEVTSISYQFIRSMSVYNDKMLIGDWHKGIILDSSLDVVEQVHLDYDGINLFDAIFDDDKNLWFADPIGGYGIIHYSRQNGSTKFYHYPGPRSALVEDIAYSNGTIAIVPGSRSGWGLNYTPASVSWLDSKGWGYNFKDFLGTPNPQDFSSVIINPKNNKDFFIASWGGGLYRFTDGKLSKHYTYLNSLLDTTGKWIFVSGLCFDKDDNLWVVNPQTNYPLKVLMSDGVTWKKFSLMGVGVKDFPEYVFIDSRNYKWITFPRNPSNQLLVFDDKTNTSRYISMNSSKVHITTTVTTCITEDKEGIIWLGTEKGIKIIASPGSAFSNGAITENILIEQLGYTEPLLKGEHITSIAVDGGNRKWIGTARAGVFLMSPDGKEELLHFTEDNSPLLSNQITRICINEDNGEVFIGTIKGLVSYRGEATKGHENYDEIKVFPNPVREDYFGNIAVSGLMDNSFCKIVDSGGHLVYQGYAYGGQFIWNGKDFHGKRPATGVYFVFASDETGKVKKVAKILFIN